MTTCLPSFRLRSRRNIPEDTQTIWATSSRWTSPKAEEDLFDDDVEDAAGIDGEVFPDNGDDMQGGEDDQMDD